MWVREMMLASLRKGEPQGQDDQQNRVLSDLHFEFQGGRNVAKGVRGVERRMPRP